MSFHCLECSMSETVERILTNNFVFWTYIKNWQLNLFLSGIRLIISSDLEEMDHSKIDTYKT
jgi:hypothetical protein